MSSDSPVASVSAATTAPAWRPTASLDALIQRNRITQSLRQYFVNTHSLEVQTPALSAAGTTDPYIDSFAVCGVSAAGDATAWLHTSPEFAMKRLLAAYGSDIHQFATVFRRDESGRHHLREFTLLEWYRVGCTMSDLLRDAQHIVNAACNALGLPALELKCVSYQDEVKRLCGVFPHEVTLSMVENVFARHGRSFPASLAESAQDEVAQGSAWSHTPAIDDALTLLMDEFVVRNFSANELTALTEYPASQASLARLGTHETGHAVACRAELFLGAVELANGFEELTDADEQSARFEYDAVVRREIGKVPVPHDRHLIDAIRSGLPECSGMALGIDRLVMVLGGYSAVSEVVAFSDANA